MPRSRETIISWAARRAAKYRFHGTVASTTSQDRAMITAPTVSIVVSGTLTIRPSQTITNVTAAPASTRSHPMISRFGFLLIPHIVLAHAVTRIG
jgi:hypothetical protein